ncbi:hypothetical protein AIOL_000173 [Candidatus Rhodobacter oscarellae]|uniref:Outer membrane protein n=1 Tax=Candidatus Rhodobacter oscarellae TaxID=1675527 RepID=A0A0J9H2W5_9RHOB|nr:lipid A-modifier LpxR family protein [Candidatus Rhodobacter lobularis]KMW60023.1 hypothetical protein AIOL_000173 [Candidatus Rhodobacter lobularis]
MRGFICLCFLATLLIAPPSRGEPRDFVGVGRLITNDALTTVVDDRWRTGAAVVSVVKAREGAAAGDAGFGELIEFRFRGEVITPENIVTPAAGDRPYAAALSFGLHTHFQARALELSLGVDVNVTGPQTGLATLQSAIHDTISVSGPSATTLAGQIPDGVHPSVTFEAGRSFAMGAHIEARPFVEVQGGLETLARVGGDIHIGRLALGELKLRDAATGQRYVVGRRDGTGWAGVIGADVAYVADSVFLPSSSGVVASDTRTRVRAGVHWKGRNLGVFYGVTWLSEEFVAQREAQTVGSLRLDLKF